MCSVSIPFMDSVMHRLALLVPLLCVIALAGCGGGKNSKREKYVQAMIADQAKYQKLATGHEVEGEKAAEAKNWLEWTNTNNIMSGKAEKKEAVRFVEDLYEAGSPRVMVLYITTQATFITNMCGSLLIELPKEKEKRAEVFKEHARIEKQFWGKKVTKIEDQGQKYLHLSMDP